MFNSLENFQTSVTININRKWKTCFSLHVTSVNGFCGPGGIPILTGAGMLDELLRGFKKSWVLVPLRVFKAKYLHLHTTRYLLGVPRSIERHFIYRHRNELRVALN